MAESNSLVAQFSFGSPAKLALGGGHGPNRKFNFEPLNASSCSFSTGGNVKSFRAKRRSARPGPFASISMSLPFAAATVSKAPAKVAPKKKKSLAEIFDYASKKALSGGLPGMVAMGLQVLSLMWLRWVV